MIAVQGYVGVVRPPSWFLASAGATGGNPGTMLGGDFCGGWSPLAGLGHPCSLRQGDPGWLQLPLEVVDVVLVIQPVIDHHAFLVV